MDETSNRTILDPQERPGFHKLRTLYELKLSYHRLHGSPLHSLYQLTSPPDFSFTIRCSSRSIPVVLQ